MLFTVATDAGAQGRPWDIPGKAPGETITGPDGAPYVWVPPGSFTMGSTDADMKALEPFGGQAKWFTAEMPAHRVSITRGLWLSKFEATNRQYRAFCEATGRALPPKIDQGADHPVVCVDWEDVQAYCQHYGLRLPTEAEWEWTARGPESLPYPWGREFEGTKCHRRLSERAGVPSGTAPVGSYPGGVSWCGAMDLIGNVREWCSDWYSRTYYAESPVADPPGPATGEVRVMRGGSWRSTPTSCRAMERCAADPTARLVHLGFRCAVSPQ